MIQSLKSTPANRAFVVVVAGVLAGVVGLASGQDSALDTYVRQPDPAYGWKLVREIPGNPARTLVVRLTSQSWRSPPDVDRVAWEHWLTIVVPDRAKSSTAFLVIGGGSHSPDPPASADAVATQIARATGCIVAELRQVPNQPLVFHNDGQPRKEDDLIAYAWDKYLHTADPTWLPRLPMVKSVVRAMDCVQEVLKSPEGGGRTVERFVVGGASKRGWTTWMTGVVDRRVAALVPIVIDVANVEASMRHHVEVYGFWANSIGDYFQHRITHRWNSPEMRNLLAIEDPYAHRDKLTMPKYIVNAAGDQFFCPDSSQFYFEGLPGEKLLRYVPNADHSLRGSDAVTSIAAFQQRVAGGIRRPELSWTFEPDGSIRAKSDQRPSRVVLWQATNSQTRDFRLEKIGAAFSSREVVATNEGMYIGAIVPPEAGWTASFLEFTYESPDLLPLKLTTAVRVLPDKLPFAGIDPTQAPYEAQVDK